MGATRLHLLRRRQLATEQRRAHGGLQVGSVRQQPRPHRMRVPDRLVALSLDAVSLRRCRLEIKVRIGIRVHDRVRQDLASAEQHRICAPSCDNSIHVLALPLRPCRAIAGQTTVQQQHCPPTPDVSPTHDSAEAAGKPSLPSRHVVQRCRGTSRDNPPLPSCKLHTH